MFTDHQSAAADLRSVATLATTLADNLPILSPADSLREPLAKAMEPQPVTFSMVLRAVAGFEFAATIAGVLGGPMGQSIEPGTAANLTALAAALEPCRADFGNLAQTFDDAVAQVMAAGGAPQGEGH